MSLLQSSVSENVMLQWLHGGSSNFQAGDSVSKNCEAVPSCSSRKEQLARRQRGQHGWQRRKKIRSDRLKKLFNLSQELLLQLHVAEHLESESRSQKCQWS